MKVGGRDFNHRKADVEEAMRGVDPESIQKYAVEVNGTKYPPKQVLARATGWERTSFTTMEAQRVLRKLGFEPTSVSVMQTGRRTFTPLADAEAGGPGLVEPSTEQRLAALEAALATAQEAIAGLGARVRALEAAN